MTIKFATVPTEATVICRVLITLKPGDTLAIWDSVVLKSILLITYAI